MSTIIVQVSYSLPLLLRLCSSSIENRLTPVTIRRNQSAERQCTRKRLKLCGFTNYMGTKPYQIIKECLEVRDAIAHGDSYTSSFNFSADHLDNQDDIARGVLAVNSEQFRGLTADLLKKYIEMAKHIDHEIYDNGYRPSEGGPPGSRA
ncbi:Uncharacterised protein [Leclercia adecarboxylata]|uniref:Uncharacterized protein n=1 Tax=Leclercia adecarboxylata TaxID=83655 RepID=A0A4U9HV01_9ENTR|nr:Uncharacterised protein [Leclercia adecarboxylata]